MTHLSYLSISLIVIGFDRLLKWLIISLFGFNGTVRLIGEFLQIRIVHNTGGAFGFLTGNGMLFVVVSSLVSAGLFVLLVGAKLRSSLVKIGIALLLGGAIGNLVDRLMWGYVVDFVEVKGFSIFNLADACVTVGVGLIAVRILFGGGEDRAWW